MVKDATGLFLNPKGGEIITIEIKAIPIDLIDPFPEHPFQVREDLDFINLVESIRENGVCFPIILRPKDQGRFEIISGHRRVRACEILEWKTIPAEVKEMTHDEAVILMVDSNLQRSEILPSEKAFAYKMRMDVTRRQGQRTDLTSRQLDDKLGSAEKIGNLVGESARQVQRYIRLTYLVPELLKLVDQGCMAMSPAVAISYLKEEEQLCVADMIKKYDSMPTYAQALLFRNYSQAGKLTRRIIEAIISEEKPNQREKLSLRYDEIKQYMPSNITPEKTIDYVMKAIKFYRAAQERAAKQRSIEER